MIVISSFTALLQLVSAAPVPNTLDFESTAKTFVGKAAVPDLSSLAAKVPAVLNNAVTSTKHSWEFGALFEALLEVEAPQLTPFGWKPEGAEVPSKLVDIYSSNILNGYDFGPVQSSASDITQYLSDNPPTPIDNKALIGGDGSLGDPAAVGPATWLLAMFADKLPQLGHNKDQLAWAAANQLRHLRETKMMDARGCISHREDEVAFWSDQGYMIPPFMAFLGLATKNPDLLEQALQQWTLTSDMLLENGLYFHTTTFDHGYWATGNGWMLAGLMRVLASIRAAGFEDRFSNDIAAAEKTAADVFKTLFQQLGDDGRLPNYMKNGDWERSKADSAGTAMVVAAYYRFYALNQGLAAPMKDDANRAYNGVVNKLNDEGWLTEVVNPEGTSNGFNVADWVKSPEGQTFTAMMHVARKDAGV